MSSARQDPSSKDSTTFLAGRTPLLYGKGVYFALGMRASEHLGALQVRRTPAGGGDHLAGACCGEWSRRRRDGGRRRPRRLQARCCCDTTVDDMKGRASSDEKTRPPPSSLAGFNQANPAAFDDSCTSSRRGCASRAATGAPWLEGVEGAAGGAGRRRPAPWSRDRPCKR